MMQVDQITDEDIQALVDNALNWHEAEYIMACIILDPRAEHRYQELCRQKELLQTWWRSYLNSH